MLLISGMVSSMSFVFGFVSKVLHWPGANATLYGGLLAFCCLFAPLWLAHRLARNGGGMSQEWQWAVGVLAGVGFAVGSTFKMMHWPLANVLIASGGLLFALVFLPMLFLKLYRTQAPAA
jgi:hypothetical protein